MHGKPQVTCKLVSPVAVAAEGRPNQVWTASIVVASSESLYTPSASPDDLIIVKIMQPSSLELPDIGDRYHMWDLWTHPPCEYQVRREARFYKEAESLQGTVIPYFYSWQTVRSFGTPVSFLHLTGVDGRSRLPGPSKCGCLRWSISLALLCWNSRNWCIHTAGKCPILYVSSIFHRLVHV